MFTLITWQMARSNPACSGQAARHVPSNQARYSPAAEDMCDEHGRLLGVFGVQSLSLQYETCA